MDTTTRAGTPLRQRMIEDMRMRKLEPRTQEGYIRAVRKLTVFLNRSPDTATVEDLRNFQLHLVDTGTSPITLNATLTGLKFFFDITLGRGELMARMQPVKLPRTVPVVLSMQEAAALIAAARNIKHQAALSVAYGAGLRASEVCRLKVGDVDSERMALRVEQGKGAKDRYAMLSPVVLQRLRAWWRIGHAQGKILPGGWLFPGLDPMEPLSARQLNRAVHDAATAAGITKRVTTHTLRHYSESREMPSCVGNALAAGGIEGLPLRLNSAYSWTSESLEESHQLVIGPEPSNSPLVWFDLLESGLLDVEIRIEIDLCCLDRLVAEPQRDHAAFGACLQQFHGHGVAQHVRAAPAASMQPSTIKILTNMPPLDTPAIDLALVEPGREVLHQTCRDPQRCWRVSLGPHLLGKEWHQREERALAYHWPKALESLSHDHLQSHHQAWPENICRVICPSFPLPQGTLGAAVSAYSWTRNSAGYSDSGIGAIPSPPTCWSARSTSA